MKTLIIGSCDLEKWLHQNRAQYTGDFLEGCLLDNFVVMTRRGYAAIYEKYLNANSSCYRVEWEPGPAQNVFKRWYDFEKQYNEYWGVEND